MSVQKDNISGKMDTLTDLIEELDDFLYEHRIPHIDVKTKRGWIMFVKSNIKNKEDDTRI